MTQYTRLVRRNVKFVTNLYTGAYINLPHRIRDVFRGEGDYMNILRPEYRHGGWLVMAKVLDVITLAGTLPVTVISPIVYTAILIEPIPELMLRRKH